MKETMQDKLTELGSSLESTLKEMGVIVLNGNVKDCGLSEIHDEYDASRWSSMLHLVKPIDNSETEPFKEVGVLNMDIDKGSGEFFINLELDEDDRMETINTNGYEIEELADTVRNGAKEYFAATA